MFTFRISELFSAAIPMNRISTPQAWLKNIP